jgi:two-component system sensor histidine kinase KdpD
MQGKRPNPDVLLRRVHEEQSQERGGKLKIYLGAAPGVGKTYTMLQDAIIQAARGVDVAVGIAESHGRQETNALLERLKIIPRQIIDYHGTKLSEFDIDRALECNPQLIVVDEMAHTNAPGARHKKRWQDIKELMDRGINVYTTLNVQHIESLSDVISQIIHAPIHEIVPDSMLDMADTIELIDLPPEDLLKRLQEGKVYFPEQALVAQTKFFRKGNLNALRELALRITAERVGTQVLLYRQDEGIQHIWPTREKILVCVGSEPESLKLVRAACRAAGNSKAEWVAVNVVTPQHQASEDQRNNAIQNLRVAEQLGAETRVISGFDVVKEILDFAREQNVTQIMIWKYIHPRWKSFFHRSLVDELVRHSGEIDVYIVTAKIGKIKQPKIFSLNQLVPWSIYGISILMVSVVTMVDFLLFPYLKAANLIMVYLLGVMLVAFFGRTGPSVVASVLSVLAFDFFFIPPFYSFAVGDVEYFFTLLVMLLVTQVISHLTILTRRQAAAAQFLERQTSSLYTLSRRLANTRGTDKLLEAGLQYIDGIFDCEVVSLLPKNNYLEIHSMNKVIQALDAKEQSVAQWVYELGQTAGLGTDTLPFSNAIYIPLVGSQETMGVLRVQPRVNKRLFTPEQLRLLESCVHQIALSLEVDRLQETTNKSEIKTETTRVRDAILQAISHDLRAPLVSIMGSAITQIEMAKELDSIEIKKLGKNIYAESEQLSRLINNLLQITYLESEEVKLQKQSCSLRNIITTVIKTLTKKLGQRPVNIIIPADLPNIPLDATLANEVFINLIDNIIKFTPSESPIDISAIIEKDNAIVNVEDHGPGIAPDEVDKLFEKFYRGRMIKTERGLGLGLAICRQIINAHGGKIWAENRTGGGASFRFTLPLSSA